MAEPLTGLIVTSYKEIAIKNNIWLSLGGIHEAVNTLISITLIYLITKDKIIIILQ